MRAKRTGVDGGCRGLRARWGPGGRSRRGHDEADVRRQALRLVLHDRAGCPLCQVAARVEKNWFSWYEIETNAEEAMVLRLRRSRGFCPTHTRGVWLGLRSNWLLTRMFADVTKFALGHAPSAGCPTCEAVAEATANAQRQLLDALGEGVAARAYAIDGDGLCVPHALAAVRVAPASVAVRIASTLRDQLATRPGLELVAGRDTDAEVRSGLLAIGRTVLGAEARRLVTLAPLDRARAELDVGCCPSCRAHQRGVDLYLDFVGRESTSRGRDNVTQLCPTHLHDLSCLDASAAAWAVEAEAARLHDDLAGYEDVVTWNARSRPARARELRRAATSRRPGLLQALGRSGARPVGYQMARRFAGTAKCLACQAGQTAVERSQALQVATGDDPRVGAAVDEAHGYCVRHAPSGGPANRVWRGRIAELRWELDEALRTGEWNARHEPKGHELTVWQHAMARHDGATMLGLSVAESAQVPPTALDEARAMRRLTRSRLQRGSTAAVEPLVDLGRGEPGVIGADRDGSERPG